MNENSVFIVAIIAGLLALLTLLGYAAYMEHVDDEYCKTIPLERMNKERCGVE